MRDESVKFYKYEVSVNDIHNYNVGSLYFYTFNDARFAAEGLMKSGRVFAVHIYECSLDDVRLGRFWWFNTYGEPVEDRILKKVD